MNLHTKQDMAKRDKDRGEPSVVEDQGLYASSCGYCKSNAKTSVSYGLWAHSLSVYDYQDLLDRGWRRSGVFLYRPEMEKTCCPAYTIRLKVDSFCMSKEQSRVMRRMQRYLDGTYNPPTSKIEGDMGVLGRQVNTGIEGDDVSMSNRPQETNHIDMDCEGICGTSWSKGKRVDTDNTARDLSNAVEDAIKSCSLSGEYPADLEVPKVALQRVKPSLRKRIKTSAGQVLYTCNVAFLCAAALSKHKDLNLLTKTFQQGDRGLEGNGIREKIPAMMAELFALKLQNKVGMHGFEVEACKGHLNFVLRNHAGFESSKTVDVCPSKSVDGDVDPLNSNSINRLPVLSPRSGCIQPKRVLEVRMRRSAFDPEEFALYKRYQIAVHHDKPGDVKESSYVRFLVDSPLTFVPPSKDGTTFCGFGSFHQQYLIDGRLVAVGVVDILPSCLSSKYLFWDPDLAVLSLGKYSSLQEIEWVQKVHTFCPSLEYYYLGYYIHSCPKMRYKGAYCPSELLCPVRFQWVPFDMAQPLLNKQPFVCLSDCLDATTMQGFSKDISVEEDLSACMEDNEAIDELMDMEESQKLVDVSQNGGAASSSKESEDVSNILLKLGNRYLQFKHLQAWMAVPQKFIDALVCDLRKYSKVVGPTLATKMAYALG